MPFLGSLLLFLASLGATAAALYGVLKTSTAADKRELNKWRRETLLRIAEEIAQGAVVLPLFGHRPVGSITLVDCEEFRADLAAP
jgi:hypothetical protein